MAHLTSCRYCKGQILNRDYHSECRAAYLEDLLCKIKDEAWVELSGKCSFDTIRRLQDRFITWDEYIKIKVENDQRKLNDELYWLLSDKDIQK